MPVGLDFDHPIGLELAQLPAHRFYGEAEEVGDIGAASAINSAPAAKCTRRVCRDRDSRCSAVSARQKPWRDSQPWQSAGMGEFWASLRTGCMAYRLLTAPI